MRPPLLTCLALALTTACEQTSPPTPAAEPANPAAPAPSTTPPRSTRTYGAALGGASVTPLAAVLDRPEGYEGQRVAVEGEVRRACSRKGCWMELAESTAPEARGVRVTFKDYGFFVPTDSAGAHARLEGVVNVTLMKKGHVEHLEEEGAKVTGKNPDGTAREVHIVATGVELTR